MRLLPALLILLLVAGCGGARLARHRPIPAWMVQQDVAAILNGMEHARMEGLLRAGP